MKAAFLFPGIGYTFDRPLLYYARKIAAECGYEEIVPVRYTYTGTNLRGDPQKMREAFDKIYDQTEQLLKDVDFHAYTEILFISKSVGTIAAAAYAEKHGLKVRHILYTPLEETFLFHPENGLVFIGTNDPWNNSDRIVQLSLTAGLTVRGIENGNHSLETGDPLVDIGTLLEVMKETKKALRSFPFR